MKKTTKTFSARVLVGAPEDIRRRVNVYWVAARDEESARRKISKNLRKFYGDHVEIEDLFEDENW